MARRDERQFQINIAIPHEVEAAVRGEAAERGTSLAQVVREILLRHYRSAEPARKKARRRAA